MKSPTEHPTNPLSFPLSNQDSMRLFSDYLKITGVAHISPESEGDPRLIGKRLGLLNGGSWITLWANYFGRMYLPGVHLVNIGNEAVQINFMQAFSSGLPTPPVSNIEAFQRYAVDLVELAQVDAVLITCSTMNRAYKQIQEILLPYRTPVYQIDRPVMERAINHGGKILVIATHGPTVESTRLLLSEVAAENHTPVSSIGAINEEAWNSLSVGDLKGHNELIANTIRKHLVTDNVTCVVLAQLSMTVFLLSYPDPLLEFGVPVFTSGRCGFEYVRDEFLSRDRP